MLFIFIIFTAIILIFPSFLNTLKKVMLKSFGHYTIVGTLQVIVRILNSHTHNHKTVLLKKSHNKSSTYLPKLQFPFSYLLKSQDVYLGEPLHFIPSRALRTSRTNRHSSLRDCFAGAPISLANLSGNLP